MQQNTLEKVDLVNNPPHYLGNPSGVECIEITEHLMCNRANAIKYAWRANDKGCTREDLQKCEWYINREIKRLQRGNLAAWRNIEIEQYYDKLYWHYLKEDDRRFFDFVEHIIFGKQDGLESALKIVKSWIGELEQC